ncbi:MAG: translation initiation factor IF-2 [Patescibacteria group bacterium]
MAKEENEQSGFRPPVVTLLGHVDHGKTALLSAIQDRDLSRQEYGGISQHTRAYQIEQELEEEKRLITFLDTPGHAAFSKMRSRGGKVADLVLLVVAANEGVEPQTKEAIKYAREADVPIIVALNKMDLDTAQPERVNQQLAEEDLTPEDWGGKITVVPVSAETGEGVDELVEIILLWAETTELEDTSDEPFQGIVIESHMDKNRGPMATVLVKQGVVRKGDEITTKQGIDEDQGLQKNINGKVKALLLEGENIQKAVPSDPVEILGFEEVPEVGAIVVSGQSEEQIRRGATRRISTYAPRDEKTINVILKADTVGTAQAVEASVEDLTLDEYQVNVVFSGVGGITESDIRLAYDTNARIFAFNTEQQTGTEGLVSDLKVTIQKYNVIYKLIEGVRNALEQRKNKVEGEVKGVGKVIKTFTLPRSGDRVAGTRVILGEIREGNRIEITRDGEVEHRARIKNIEEKREDVEKATKGMEVGILFYPQFKVKVGDMIEVI